MPTPPLEIATTRQSSTFSQEFEVSAWTSNYHVHKHTAMVDMLVLFAFMRVYANISLSATGHTL